MQEGSKLQGAESWPVSPGGAPPRPPPPAHLPIRIHPLGTQPRPLPDSIRLFFTQRFQSVHLTDVKRLSRMSVKLSIKISSIIYMRKNLNYAHCQIQRRWLLESLKLDLSSCPNLLVYLCLYNIFFSYSSESCSLQLWLSMRTSLQSWFDYSLLRDKEVSVGWQMNRVWVI